MELLVAVVILVIVASVGIASYGKAQIAGRDGKRIGDLQEIQKALETYYALNKAYPSGAGALLSSLTALEDYFAAKKIPSDPTDSGANQYKYYSVGTCATKQYIVCTALESCGTKCNRYTDPSTTLCDTSVNEAPPTPGAKLTLYCVNSLSN